MRWFILILGVGVLWCGAGRQTAFAQRGVGDSDGVARQAVLPKLAALDGKVLEIETGPCAATTGRALTGTHVIVQSAEAKKNVHLGPQTAVRDIADKLAVGQTVSMKVFRTPSMEQGHYVAQSLVVDGETLVLRDETLRPVWAGATQTRRGPGWGRGRGRGGYGWGTGNNSAYYCPRWGGPPPRPGTAEWSGRGAGRGAGRGSGGGRGWGRAW